MKKIYYLSTCDTCKRIIKETGITKADFEFQDVKFTPLTQKQIDQLAKMSGSYEALFSRKARKYKEMRLSEQTLGEADFRRLIAQEYTFLKRPVVIIEQQIFVGNSPKNILQLKEAVAKN